MSMPQPIHVVLIGATRARVHSARRHLRMATPGIGAPYLCALDADGTDKVVAPSELPKACITLWLALDLESLQVAQKLHAEDLRLPRYGRGFYNDRLPEACVLVEGDTLEQQAALRSWEQRIAKAWYESS